MQSLQSKSGSLQIFLVFLKIGISSFGASTSETVIEYIGQKKKWLVISQLREAIAVSGLCPGPFHINFVMAVGLKLRGTSGQLAALLGFIFPAFIILIFVAEFFFSSSVYELLSASDGISKGLVAAICGLLINSILKIGRGAVQTKTEAAAVLIILSLFIVYKISFILAILGATVFFLLLELLRTKV